MAMLADVQRPFRVSAARDVTLLSPFLTDGALPKIGKHVSRFSNTPPMVENFNYLSNYLLTGYVHHASSHIWNFVSTDCGEMTL